MSPIPGNAWSLLRQRPFASFCGARFLSGAATQMQNVAVGWLIYDITHSALALGLAGLAAFTPAILLALVTGHVADAVERRLILVATYGLLAVVSVGLFACVLSGREPLGLIYALIVVTGVAQAFSKPASQALIPSLVARTDLAPAVALASSSWQTATILGPSIGGLLYALGPAVVFGTAACCFALASVLALAIRTPARTGERRAADWASLVAGIGFIRARPILLGAISLDLFAVLLGGATALLPIYAQSVLQTGPWGLGLLRSMPGLGAVAMSIVIASWPLQHRAGTRLFQAVAIFGLATIVFGLSRSVPLSMACLFVAGAADTVSVVVRLSLVQSETPDEMRGRVAAVNSVFIGASNELGEFESGLLAAAFGAVPAVVIGGLGTIVVAGLWIKLFPALARRDRLIE